MLNIKRDPETQKLHFEGFLVDLMEKLASDLSINYTMKFSKSKGKFNGGDGTLRTVRFSQDMDVSFLASHRKVPPFGLEGGETGECGANHIRRADGTVEECEGCSQHVCAAGDAAIITTPSGGAFGKV